MTNDKKSRYDFVHGVRFGERQSFTNETSARLSQSVIPTFHMIGLPAPFANTLMGFYWKDQLIRFPEIAVTLAALVFLRNLLPKRTASRLASIPNGKRHNLASPSTHDRPNPAFVPLFIDKWPHFIDFQDVFRLGAQKCIFKFRIAFVFFLAKLPASDDWRQMYGVCLAYWNVHSRLIWSVPFVLGCIHAWVQEHHACHTPYTGIADCHLHYDRFSQYFGYHSFGTCIQSVLLSCPNYTTNHFNLTTTNFSSSLAPLQNMLVACVV